MATIKASSAVLRFFEKVGRKGGLSTSRAKVRASRRNGKLGGRPRKSSEK